MTLNVSEVIEKIISTLTAYGQGEATDTEQKAAASLLDFLKDKLGSDEEAIGQLNWFVKNPKRYVQVFKDILQEKLSKDFDFAKELNDISGKSGLPQIQFSLDTFSIQPDEQQVLKALDAIGGGGDPVDIALEGMLEIKKTEEVAQRLWSKGLLHAHRMKDSEAKRFFSFSDLGEKAYKQLLGTKKDGS